MSAPAPPVPTGHAPADLLLNLARIVHRAAGHDRSHLVALSGPLGGADGDEVDLLMRPLDGHPVDTLAGFDAPAEWTVLGVIATGTARHLEELQATDGSTADPPVPPGRVVTTYLVGRDGTSASICEPPGGSPWETRAAGLHDAAIGRIDDCLRRALDLPTHPVGAGPGDLWARIWLDELLAAACADPARHWSWTTAALHHTAARAVAGEGLGRASEVADALPRLGEILEAGRGWTQLRAACASGEWSTGSIPAGLAEWMDDGMFGRWLLDELPPCGHQLVALRELLPATVVDRIEATLTGWGIGVEETANGGWTSSHR